MVLRQGMKCRFNFLNKGSQVFLIKLEGYYFENILKLLFLYLFCNSYFILRYLEYNKVY